MVCRVELSGDTLVQDAKQVICDAIEEAARQKAGDVEQPVHVMGSSGPMPLPRPTHCRLRVAQGSKLGHALVDTGSLSSGSRTRLRDGMVLIVQRTAVKETL